VLVCLSLFGAHSGERCGGGMLLNRQLDGGKTAVFMFKA